MRFLLLNFTFQWTLAVTSKWPKNIEWIIYFTQTAYIFIRYWHYSCKIMWHRETKIDQKWRANESEGVDDIILKRSTTVQTLSLLASLSFSLCVYVKNTQNMDEHPHSTVLHFTSYLIAFCQIISSGYWCQVGANHAFVNEMEETETHTQQRQQHFKAKIKLNHEKDVCICTIRTVSRILNI